ncbi:MAG TPA: N-6 DNA methylase, partial [Pseudomonas sp.]|nr:N-6 DNA methylase [Pseudomonas sp.]
MFLHQANRPFTHFPGKLIRFVHGSILSRVGASSKPGAVQGDLAIYGQELMAQTRRLCLMNLAVHGLDGNIGQSYGSSFTNDQH